MRGEPPKAKQGWGSARAAEDVTAETSAEKIGEGSVTRITRERISNIVLRRGKGKLYVYVGEEADVVKTSHNANPAFCESAYMVLVKAELSVITQIFEK